MKSLALNILDIVQNSIRARANEITIRITESSEEDIYTIEIRDNGSGIPDGIIDNVTDPFVTTRTTRKIGMGLPLLRHHAELTGGSLKIKSKEGMGTEIKATFSFRHLDRQPLGDITGVLKIIIAANPGIDFIYNHLTDKGEYSFSTRETKEYLETDSLYENSLLDDIAGMIGENLKGIGATGFDYRGNV
jgi:DNA mismatch repair ATPase MutL